MKNSADRGVCKYTPNSRCRPSPCCFCHVYRLFRRETSKMFRQLSSHFVLTAKISEPRPQVFSVDGLITCNQGALLTSSVQYDKILAKFGQQ